MKTVLRSASIALLAMAVLAPNADAQFEKCQRTIAKASSQFLQARVKALAKCEEGIVKSGVAGSCPDAKATASIDKAVGKLNASIGKSCGGVNKVCGDLGGNIAPDFEPTAADLGWPAQCPNFEKGDCTNPITTCGDIATCLACIGGSASDQAMALYYDDIVLQTADKGLNKCQVTIGKATSAYLNSRSKILQKCWDARINGKHTGECFPLSAGDGKYQAALDKAEAKKVSSICKACGGADKVCGGMDDLTPAAIGFPSDCTLVTVPGGAACSGAITDLNSLVACVDCVTDFKTACVDRLQVPQFTPYPAGCNTCTLPAPTGACPTTLSFTAEGEKVDLDTGFTGLAHDAKVPTNGRITLNVTNCDSVNHPGCGECDVDGPIDNAGGVTFNNHRCQDASWVQCSSDLDCTSATQCVGGTNNGVACSNASECPGGSCDNAGFAGPCIYFFGSPLPLVAGGVSTCVVNEISAAVAGTINIDDGTSTTAVPLRSKVHIAADEDAPCPQCLAGTCQAGPRGTLPCTVTGNSVFFGDVSLDCPPSPGSQVGNLTINLNIATGTQTKTVEAANVSCRETGFTSLKCLCDSCNTLDAEGCNTNADCPPSGGEAGICGGRRCLGGIEAGKPCSVCLGGTNHGALCGDSSACPGGTCSLGCAGGGSCGRPGQPTAPNACLTDTSTPGLDCVDIGNNEGQCASGPSELVCSIQTYLTCDDDTDCTSPPGQTCILRPRPCFTDNGVIGNSILVSGNPDTPCGGVAKPTVGTFFCVSPVGASAVNAAGGLPALGRVRIPGVVVIDP